MQGLQKWCNVRKFNMGKGIGGLLLHTLINKDEGIGFWTLRARIFLENVARLKIRYKNGFREVGRREQIGEMDGTWHDTILLKEEVRRLGLIKLIV